MGEMIRFDRPDGQSCAGYLAGPAHGGAAPGVVVLQEWWGLASPKSHAQHTTEAIARAGFRALAPDLYHGKSADTGEGAEALMNGLDFGAAVTQDIRGAINHLKATGSSKVAVMGFCMGGALTILSLLHLGEADAGVCFYGIPPSAAGDPASIKVPLLGHFAMHDGWCTPDAVNALEARLQAGGVRYELHRYDAQHAFANHLRPEVHDAEKTRLAWDRSVAFLRQHLA